MPSKLACLAAASSLLLVLLVQSVPTTQAFVSDVPLVGLYLQRDAEGARKLSFAPPPETSVTSIPLLVASGNLTPATAPVCVTGSACTPPLAPLASPCASVAAQTVGQCAAVNLGSTLVPRGFRIIAHSALNVWLRADQATLLESLHVQLQRVSHDGKTTTLLQHYTLESGQGGQVRAAPVQLGTTAVGLTLGARSNNPAAVINEEHVQLVVTLVRTAASAPPTNLYVVHSAQQPTGVLLPVQYEAGSGAFSLQRRGENTLGVYLGPNALQFLPPEGSQSFSRRLGTAAGVQPTEMRWGSGVIDENATIVGAALFLLHLRVHDDILQGEARGPGATLAMQLRLSLHIGSRSFTTHSPASPTLLASTGANEAWYVGAIPLPRLHVEAGTVIDAGISLVAHSVHGGVEVLHGSTRHASGFWIPTLGGGHYFPPPETTPSPTPPPPPPAEAPANETPAPSSAPASTAEAAPASSPAATTQPTPDAAPIAEGKEVSRPTPAPNASLGIFLCALAGLLLVRRK